MNRKTTPPKRKLGNTRYVFTNYSEYIQRKNEFVYRLIEFEKALDSLKEGIHDLRAFRPAVVLEPA